MTTTESPSNKRRFKRAGWSKFVVLYVDGQEHGCTLLNLSGGGAAVKTHLRPALGRAVNLQVPGLGLFQGDIVRHLDDGVAIHFKIEDSRQHDLDDKVTEDKLPKATDTSE